MPDKLKKLLADFVEKISGRPTFAGSPEKRSRKLVLLPASRAKTCPEENVRSTELPGTVRLLTFSTELAEAVLDNAILKDVAAKKW